MPWTHTGSIVVIVAQQLNPTIFTQIWLTDHGILGKEDLMEGSLFSDFVVQVRSKFFQMLVLPEQMQFVPSVVPEQQQALLLDKLGTIIKLLPQTPYKGLGVNFIWHLTPADGNIARLTRELFFVPERPLQSNFAVENAHYGGYFSKDAHGFRLKLDVKPVLAELAGGGSEHRLQFGFNYHIDLGEDAPRLIEERLQHWNELRQETERIIDSVEVRQP